MLHRTLRLAGTALCLTLALPLAAAAQELPPAKQLLDRYVEAVGGRDALKKHQFRTIESVTEMPAAGVKMTTRTVQAAPDRVVTTVEMPGMGASRSGYDGTVAWQINPMSGPSLLDGVAKDQMVLQADFNALLEPERLYKSVETVERTEFGGQSCYRVKFVSHTGIESWQCFDTETGLAVAMGGKQESQMGSVDMTMLFSDYREFDGIRSPARMTASMMGQQMITTVNSISHAPVDPSVFAPPQEIQALVAARKN